MNHWFNLCINSLQVCINDELVLSGFATFVSDTVQSSETSPGKAAKLQAINNKFQKEGAQVIKNLKEYISHGKFTGSEQSNSTDDEQMDYARHNHRILGSGESPLNILRRQVTGTYGAENGILGEPSARIPKGASQMVPSQRSSPEKSLTDNAYVNSLEKESMSGRTDTFSCDESSGRVRFLSSRLPATGSGSIRGYSSIPSKSPDSSNLKPILKKRSPRSTACQSSGSSSEPEESFQRKRMQLDKEDSGYSCSEITEFAFYDRKDDISCMENKNKEPAASSNAINVDVLFRSHGKTTHSVSENANFDQRAEPIVPLKQNEERGTQRVSSVIESLRNANEKRYSQMSVTSSVDARAFEAQEALYKTAGQPLAQRSLAGYDYPPTHSSVCDKDHQTFRNNTPVGTNLSPNSSSSSIKSPLPSERLLSSQSPSSPLHVPSGRKVTFSNGVLIQTEGAPAPRPIFSLDHSPFAHHLRQLNITSPSLIQAHAWPAVMRGRDVMGVCTANEGPVLAYLVPIIYQLVEEREMYADLPLKGGVSDMFM